MPAAAAVSAQPAQSAAKVAPEFGVVSKTSAKVNAAAKKATKPALKARGRLKTPAKKSVRSLEDVKMNENYIVR